MNSKQRVKATIEGRPVDHIPLCFYVVDCDIIARVIGRKTYVRDKVRSQLAFWEGRRDEVVESYKKDTVEFYRKIDCVDLIAFKESPIVPPKGSLPVKVKKIADDTFEHESGRVYKISFLSNELVCVKDPNLKDLDEYNAAMFPEPAESDLKPPDPSVFEACDYLVENLGPDRYIAGSSGGITAFTRIGGMETGLMMYAVHPEVIHAWNRRSVKMQNYLDQYFIRPGQDGVLLEQDMGGTGGPLISPRQFREVCLPYLKQRVRHIKEFNQQVILHNCGNNRPLMNMFIEAGIQAYQSLQTNAGMDVGSLQMEFGKSMIFIGGIAMENLIQGTPEDVRKNVRQAWTTGMQSMEQGYTRGFILGPSHSIAYGTKYDNFMAMIDEYHRLSS